MTAEHSRVVLHHSFTVKDCTFLSAEKGVIYSPVNGETLLCEPSVIHYLVQLESEPDKAYGQLVRAHPTRAAEIIQQLSELHIIEIQYQSGRSENE